ncbi:hypothetical protein RJ640_022721 [Escallonia rubra]|uniref:Uncharacterized protein n=1 Tax=Escallonia rubra TaxID=112253 RepID=A0AA88UD03_9ASTE|nr:hypothetical protein RJ640_022721 [Escallonia rubra]
MVWIVVVGGDGDDQMVVVGDSGIGLRQIMEYVVREAMAGELKMEGELRWRRLEAVAAEVGGEKTSN